MRWSRYLVGQAEMECGSALGQHGLAAGGCRHTTRQDGYIGRKTRGSRVNHNWLHVGHRRTLPIAFQCSAACLAAQDHCSNLHVLTAHSRGLQQQQRIAAQGIGENTACRRDSLPAIAAGATPSPQP